MINSSWLSFLPIDDYDSLTRSNKFFLLATSSKM
jgi:hypothetical protein